MKPLLTIFFTILCLSAFCQKTDTVKIYVFERSDTIPIKGILLNCNGKVKFQSPAFVTLHGSKIINNKGALEWAQEPKLSGVLDKNKKSIKNWIQIIQ